MTPNLASDLPKAIRHWKRTDPVMARLAKATPPAAPRRLREGAFGDLVASLIHQQVSIAAGRTILLRLRSACGGSLEPDAIVRLGPDGLRACGVSRQKQGYLLDLSRKVQQGALDLRRLRRATDSEVIEALTQVKGIGVWTAKMFLLFHLQRPDVVSPEDLGLQSAVSRAYAVPMGRARRFLERKTPDWSPYGTLACLTLWASKDAKGDE